MNDRAASENTDDPDHADPDHADPEHADPEHAEEVVAAIGKASEALEYVERARGHLYEFHQLMGRADIEFGNAADMLRDAGLADDADRIDDEIVGRNVLDGRWTFQIVDEFDDLYHGAATAAVRGLERDHLGGRRHLYEAGLKAERRSAGRPEHAARPPAGAADVVNTATEYDS